MIRMIFLLALSISLALALTAQPAAQYTASGLRLQLPDGWLLGEVAAVEKNAEGHIFVLNRGDHKLLEFDGNGTFIKEIGAGQNTFEVPHGLKIDADGNIWTTDVGSHIVIQFSPAGEVLKVLGRKGQQGEYMKKWNYVIFDQPTDVDFGPDGSIYVTDGYGNNRVVKFNKAGEHIRTWGTKGIKPGEFDLPHCVTVHDGKVYVGDRENKRIQIFDLDGHYLDQWDNTGYPYSIKIHDGYLYSLDGVATKVFLFDLNGRKVGEFAPPRGFARGELSRPHWIAVDAEGIWIAEVLSWRAQHFHKE